MFQAFKAAGQPVYLVGGAVRDAVRGAPVGDLDLATPATPEEMQALAKVAGLRVVPTGLEHGTLTLVSGGEGHEVTSFRRDEETFGRHARVAFTREMSEDARRRDFTMNALYAGADGAVIDPLGGLNDALAGRVRFIEDAEQRIVEDYLRILRFFRFSAWYGAEGIDADGLAACAAHHDGLSGIARERIGAELCKLLAAPDPAPVVAAMRAANVLQQCLPGAQDRALAPLVHLEGRFGAAPDPLRRLAALGGADALDHLRLSRTDAARLKLLRQGAEAPDGPAALGYYHGAQVAWDMVLLRAALLEMDVPEGAATQIADGAAARFPITAADLMPAFTGPALGARIKALEALWIASGFTLTRDQLLEERP
nr:CCA tRNA nucleotidyltransferase [Roseovarius carneus]